MLALPSRQYARRIEAVGRTERLIGLLLLLLLAGIVAAFVVTVAGDREYLFEVDEAAYATGSASATALAGSATPSPGTQLANPFSDPGVAGWRRPTKVARYSPDDLHVKIDGRAEAYRQFHVAGLTFGTYEHEADASRTIDAYWYDFGEPGSAAGMYRSEAAPDGTPVSVGTEGYEIGGAVFFWQGISYVQVLPSRAGEGDAGICLKIAERIAERIGSGTP